MTHGEAAHMHFIDNALMPGSMRRRIQPPGIGGIDDFTFGQESGAVPAIKRQILLIIAHDVTKQRIMPL